MRLIDADDRADRQVHEKLFRGVTREPNAAMRCRVRLDYALMKAEIATAQPHEIGHRTFVNGRAMIAVLVRDHVVTRLGAESIAPRRNLRCENGLACLDHHHMLLRE